MSQSLDKIGVQFIADMSDMVSKMNGMTAFTKNWAEKLATNMFSATPEQKQFSFISSLRQSEINDYNERKQREYEMASLKERLEEERVARAKRNAEEIARHEIEVATLIAAERDNNYNTQKQKERELNARLAAEEMQAVDNMRNEETIKALQLAAFKKRLQEEADQQAETAQEDAVDRQVRLARLRADAQQAVMGTSDPYEEDRRSRERAKANEIAADAERAKRAEEQRLATLNLSNKMQEEANNLVYRSRTIQERYNDELGRLNSLHTHKNVLTGRTFLNDKNYQRLVTQLTISTIRQQQAQKELNREMINSGQSYRGMTGAMTQLAFAAEDFTQVMSMSGNMGMALMSASNNLTMVAHSFITVGSTMSIVAGVGIPLLLTGIGMLARSFSSASREAEELDKRLESIRNRSREDFTLGLRERQRNFEASLREQTSPSAISKQIEEGKRQQITLEENLRLTREKARKEIDAQILSVQKAQKQIEQYYNFANPRSAQDVKTQQRLREEGERAVKQYKAAREELSKTTMNNAEDAQVALRKFLLSIEGIGGLTELRARIEKVLADAMSGTVDAHNEVYKLMKEIEALQLEREQSQQRLNELVEQERQNRAGELKAEQQILEAKREQILAEMKMTEEQKKMNSLRERQLEFIGYDPATFGIGAGFAGVAGAAANAAMQQQADQLGQQFLLAEQAKLQKEMIEAIQQPPVAAKMEQNAFQAQTDAMKQVMDAANRKTDTKQEAMVRHLANISAAIQNGGVIVNVVP